MVDEAAKLYIYPEQYKGQESHPLIFCTGPVPAQQLDPFIPWLMRQTGAGKFYMRSADYIWPHTTAAAIIFWPSGLVPRSSSGGDVVEADRHSPDGVRRECLIGSDRAGEIPAMDQQVTDQEPGQLLLRNPPELVTGVPQ